MVTKTQLLLSRRGIQSVPQKQRLVQQEIDQAKQALEYSQSQADIDSQNAEAQERYEAALQTYNAAKAEEALWERAQELVFKGKGYAAKGDPQLWGKVRKIQEFQSESEKSDFINLQRAGFAPKYERAESVDGQLGELNLTLGELGDISQLPRNLQQPVSDAVRTTSMEVIEAGKQPIPTPSKVVNIPKPTITQRIVGAIKSIPKKVSYIPTPDITQNVVNFGKQMSQSNLYEDVIESKDKISSLSSELQDLEQGYDAEAGWASEEDQNAYESTYQDYEDAVQNYQDIGGKIDEEGYFQDPTVPKGAYIRMGGKSVFIGKDYPITDYPELSIKDPTNRFLASASSEPGRILGGIGAAMDKRNLDRNFVLVNGKKTEVIGDVFMRTDGGVSTPAPTIKAPGGWRKELFTGESAGRVIPYLTPAGEFIFKTELASRAVGEFDLQVDKAKEKVADDFSNIWKPSTYSDVVVGTASQFWKKYPGETIAGLTWGAIKIAGTGAKAFQKKAYGLTEDLSKTELNAMLSKLDKTAAENIMAKDVIVVKTAKGIRYRVKFTGEGIGAEITPGSRTFISTPAREFFGAKPIYSGVPTGEVITRQWLSGIPGFYTRPKTSLITRAEAQASRSRIIGQMSRTPGTGWGFAPWESKFTRSQAETFLRRTTPKIKTFKTDYKGYIDYGMGEPKVNLWGDEVIKKWKLPYTYDFGSQGVKLYTSSFTGGGVPRKLKITDFWEGVTPKRKVVKDEFSFFKGKGETYEFMKPIGKRSKTYDQYSVVKKEGAIIQEPTFPIKGGSITDYKANTLSFDTTYGQPRKSFLSKAEVKVKSPTIEKIKTYNFETGTISARKFGFTSPENVWGQIAYFEISSPVKAASRWKINPAKIKKTPFSKTFGIPKPKPLAQPKPSPKSQLLVPTPKPQTKPKLTPAQDVIAGATAKFSGVKVIAPKAKPFLPTPDITTNIFGMAGVGKETTRFTSPVNIIQPVKLEGRFQPVKTKSILDIKLKLKSATKQQKQTRQQPELKMEQKIQQKAKQQAKAEQKANQRFQQKMKLNQRLNQRLTQGLMQVPRIQTPRTPPRTPRVPTIKIPIIPIPLSETKKGKGKKEKKKGLFVTEFRRKGKFQAISEPVPFLKAVGIGKSAAIKTLGASFRITKKGKVVELNPIAGFRKAKKEKGVLVQEKWLRLKSSTERKEIQQARRIAW